VKGIPITNKRMKRSNKIKTRINLEIFAKEVRLIDSEGNQRGIVQISEAINIAGDIGLDLVEISPNAKPPVCKVMDYGKYRYEQTKKKQEAKKRQNIFQVKEIKVRPKTGEHDLQVKLGHIKKFIGKNDRVKVTVMFKGREITLSQKGREILAMIAEETSDIAVVEQYPKMEGRIMFMVLAPKN